MAYLKVARMGAPVLRKRAEPIDKDELKSNEFQKFLDDLVDTMREYDGVGLAAPQVFVSKRVFVYELPPAKGESEKPETKIIINPVLSGFSRESYSDWEGCLSLPDLRGVVERPYAVTVEALDRDGKKLKFRASGFHARVVQHEFDHLEGRLFIDRMSDLTTLSFLEEYIKYHQSRSV